MNVAICYGSFRVNTHLSIQWDIMLKKKKLWAKTNKQTANATISWLDWAGALGLHLTQMFCIIYFDRHSGAH